MKRVLRDRNVRIVQMAASGMKGEAIATELKMSRSAVYAILQDHRLASDGDMPPSRAPVPYSDEDLATLKTLYLARVPMLDIARKLGRSRNSVEKRLSDLRRDGDLVPQQSAHAGKLTRVDKGIGPNGDARQREADRLFVRKLALAFMRGDHLSRRLAA